MAHSIDRPKRFAGTDVERTANRDSHSWSEGWCDRCGCRETHIHAEWPCGAEVPREILTIEDDTPEDAEPVTDEFVPELERLFRHPRLTVEAGDYDVRFAGTVRLSLYETANLTRKLKRHLEEHGYTI